MAYRATNIKPLCVQCAEIATRHCQRCGRPLCWRHHTDLPDRRCNHCEAEYQRSPRGVLALEVLVVTLLVVGSIVIAAQFTEGVMAYPGNGHPLILIIPALIAGVPALWFWTSRKLARRRFLRQRP